jgi:hypothetical protein
VGGRGGEENFAYVGRKVNQGSRIAEVGSVAWGEQVKPGFA